jgi:hypothetical protein
MSKRNLKDKYLADPAARKFLKKHPEFNDRFLDDGDGGPQWNVSVGRYSLKNITPDQDIYGTVMLEALHALPDTHVYKPLLEAYYIENAPLNELQRRYAPHTTVNALWQKLHRAKKAALRAWMRPKTLKNLNPPVAEREFIYKEKRAAVYLRYCGNTNDTVWTLKDGTVLPENVQDILDNNVDFKEWDIIFIDALT